MQYILDVLDALTKGEIYHYFKSKKGSFNVVKTNMAKNHINIFEQIKINISLKGAEKLKRLVKFIIISETTKIVIYIGTHFFDNLKFLEMRM